MNVHDRMVDTSVEHDRMERSDVVQLVVVHRRVLRRFHDDDDDDVPPAVAGLRPVVVAVQQRSQRPQLQQPGSPPPSRCCSSPQQRYAVEVLVHPRVDDDKSGRCGVDPANRGDNWRGRDADRAGVWPLAWRHGR